MVSRSLSWSGSQWRELVAVVVVLVVVNGGCGCGGSGCYYGGQLLLISLFLPIYYRIP